MKIKNLAMASALAMGAVGMTAVSAPAQAGLTGNIGVMSKYYFRGTLEADQATGFGGIDYEDDSGIYVGAWVADLGDPTAVSATGGGGVEIDVYGGYAGMAGDLGYYVGFTTYNYTSGSSNDDIYELNVGVSYDFLSLAVDYGDFNDSDVDYVHVALSASYGGLSLTGGIFEEDAEGAYVELGYSASLAEGLDMDFALGYSDDDLQDDEYVMVTLTKGFDINF